MMQNYFREKKLEKEKPAFFLILLSLDVRICNWWLLEQMYYFCFIQKHKKYGFSKGSNGEIIFSLFHLAAKMKAFHQTGNEKIQRTNKVDKWNCENIRDKKNDSFLVIVIKS